MRLDKLTVKSREAIAAAETLARRLDHQEVKPLHALAALVDQSDGLVTPLIERAGVAVDRLRSEIQAAFDAVPKVTGGEIYAGKELKKLVDAAASEAEFVEIARGYIPA